MARAAISLAAAGEATVAPVAPVAVPAAGNGHGGEHPRTGLWGERMAHVGYYLLAGGRGALEKPCGYRPAGLARLRRWLGVHPTPVYMGGILLTAAALTAAAVVYAAGRGTVLQAILAGLLALIPAVTAAVGLVDWLITLAVRPKVLPKIDFADGIPASCRTLVVVPAMLTGTAAVRSLLQQIELHYLRNPDPQIYFALLTDFANAAQPQMPEDGPLLEEALAGIDALNRRYAQGEDGAAPEGTHATDGAGGPFYLFHRERRWNPREGVWMGWERKRGKLQEFNRLAARRPMDTSFTVADGPAEPCAACAT